MTKDDLNKVTIDDALEVLADVPTEADDLFKACILKVKATSGETQSQWRMLAAFANRLKAMDDPDRVRGLRAFPKTVRPPRVVTPIPEGVTAPACLACGKPTVIRTASATGAKFWGCTGFPVCKKGAGPYTPPEGT